MSDGSIVQLSAYPGWIVGVSRSALMDSYLCWVIDPDLTLLNDGREYETSNAAMMAGRAYVERNLLV